MYWNHPGRQGGDIRQQPVPGWPPAERVPSTFQWNSGRNDVNWSKGSRITGFEAVWSTPLINSFPQAQVAEGNASIEMRASEVQIITKIVSPAMLFQLDYLHMRWTCRFDLLVAPQTDADLVSTTHNIQPRYIHNEIIMRNGVFIAHVSPCPHLWQISLWFHNVGDGGDPPASLFDRFSIESTIFPTKVPGW